MRCGKAVLRVRERVAVQARAWATASGALAEALDLCRTLQAPYTEAETHYGYGLLHSRRDESCPAREHFAAALAILDRLGERLYAGHVRSALTAVEGAVEVRISQPNATVRGAPTP